MPHSALQLSGRPRAAALSPCLQRMRTQSLERTRFAARTPSHCDMLRHERCRLGERMYRYPAIATLMSISRADTRAKEMPAAEYRAKPPRHEQASPLKQQDNTSDSWRWLSCQLAYAAKVSSASGKTIAQP